MVLDSLSLPFAAAVLLISSAVIAFSYSYMAAEKFYLRFHFLVFLFIVSMLSLIFSPHLITLLLG